MTKNLYIFSGLGADERVFQKLDLAGYRPVFVRWILPQEKESIESYATRLLDQIRFEKPILMGLSFGGMMAVEVAKLIDTEKVILISSAKTEKEIPFYFRVAGQLGLHRLLPAGLLKRSNHITNWLFGATSAFEKQLLKQILTDTDPNFMKWSIDKMVRWKNRWQPNHVFHIHGTKDRVLPLKYVAYNAVIKGGGHFMVLNRAAELDEVLQQQLNVPGEAGV